MQSKQNYCLLKMAILISNEDSRTCIYQKSRLYLPKKADYCLMKITTICNPMKVAELQSIKREASSLSIADSRTATVKGGIILLSTEESRMLSTRDSR